VIHEDNKEYAWKYVRFQVCLRIDNKEFKLKDILARCFVCTTQTSLEPNLSPSVKQIRIYRVDVEHEFCVGTLLARSLASGSVAPTPETE
jgi:hypothetical protein